MCDGDCCKKEKPEKEHSTHDMLMNQPPMVWVALAVGFAVAMVIKK